MTLENRVRIRQLNIEPPDKCEFRGLIRAAVDRLNDAENEALAYASRFDLAYGVAHSLALAALRASGHRSDKRIAAPSHRIHRPKQEYGLQIYY